MNIKNIKNFREIDFKYEDLLKNKEELEELIAKRKNTYEVASKLFQDNGEDVTTLDKLKDEIKENETTLENYNWTIISLSPIMNMMQEVTDMSTNYMLDIKRALETGDYSVEELKNNANKINVEVNKVLAAEKEKYKEQIIHIVKESDLNRVFAGVTWAVTRSVKLLTDNYITTNDKINELEESKSKLKEELTNKTNRYQELIDNVNSDKDILEINTLDEEITSIRSELNSTIKELLDYNKNKEDILSEIESYIGSYAPKEEVKEETLENNELEEEKIETPSDVIDAEFSENKENNNDKKELKEEKLENKESEEVDIPEEIEAINEEEVEDLSKADERTLMPKKPKVKDVSQSTNLYEIAEVIQQLNPNAEIRVADMGLDSMATQRFYSSVPVDQLVLPEGFYYNDKNGITNKHNTQTGMYCALEVEDLSKADERTLMPKKLKVKDVSQSTNLYEIAEVIQQLNPNAEIRVADMGLDSMATQRFYSSVPVDQLVLPEGFYYNDKNGITNKHNTQTGMYCALEVEDLSKADERTLMPKKPKVKDVSQSTNLYEIAEEVEVKPEEIMPSTPSLNNDLDYSFMDRVSSGKVSDKLMGEIKDTINEKEAIEKDNELDYSFVNMVNKNAVNIVAYNGPSTKDIVKATENYVTAPKKEESSHKFSIKGKLSKWIFKAVLAGVAAIGLYFGLTNKNETTATMSTLEVDAETGEHERVRTSLAVQDGAVYIKYTDGISEKVSVVDTNGNLLPAGTEIFDARGTSYTIERYETAYNSTGAYIVAIVSASILAMNAAKDFKNKSNGSQQSNVSEASENGINNELSPSNKLENTQELEPVQAHNTEKFVPPMEVPVGAEEISNNDILRSVEENDTDTLVVDDDMFVPPMELPDENPFEVKNVSNTKEKIKKLVNDINAVNVGSGAYYNGAKNIITNLPAEQLVLPSGYDLENGKITNHEDIELEVTSFVKVNNDLSDELAKQLTKK